MMFPDWVFYPLGPLLVILLIEEVMIYILQSRENKNKTKSNEQ